jgi:hypothetical protein
MFSINDRTTSRQIDIKLQTPKPRSLHRFIDAAFAVASGLATCLFISIPARAEVFFNAPNVLGGIRNVSVTIPSTGVTGFYDVILRNGTFSAVFGDPPSLDVTTSSDAETLMLISANAINRYREDVLPPPEPLSFGVQGELAYYLPYANPVDSGGGITVVPASVSGPPPTPNFCPPPFVELLACWLRINPTLGSVSASDSLVWVDLQPAQAPVPTPLPLAGGAAALGWARLIRRRICIGRESGS